MDQQSKICTSCGTHNNVMYTYCKHCGIPLNSAQTAAPQPPSPPLPVPPSDASAQQGQLPLSPPQYSDPAPPFIPPSYSGQAPPVGAYPPPPPVPPSVPYQQPPTGAYPPPPVIDNIDGVPVAAVSAFVGENAPAIVPKFVAMQAKKSKTSWNWPVFLLMFLIGPVIASCWFFHRRMNKIATIILAAGAVLEGIATIVLYRELMQIIRVITEIPISAWDDPAMPAGFSGVISSLFLISVISSIIGVITIAAAVILALFANHLYKNHVVSSLKRMAVEPDGVTDEKLRQRGGTRVLAWVLVLAAALAISIVSSIAFSTMFIMEFGPFFEQFSSSNFGGSII